MAKEVKDGWQTATKYFWGYFDTASFTKRAVPDCEARGWGCHDQHVYVGLCADRQRAERDGPLRTGRMFCACVPCTMLDFDRCEMAKQMGLTRLVTVPLPRGTASRVPQIESLQEWADLLKPPMVVGVRATGAEQHLEGKVRCQAQLSAHALSIGLALALSLPLVLPLLAPAGLAVSCRE